MGTVSTLPRRTPEAFWAEMSCCEHAVQIYGNDRVFLDGLAGYVGHGLRNGEASIVVATALHLHGLEARLRESAIDVDRALAENRYVPRLAEDVLATVMDKEWPDEKLFRELFAGLVARTRGPGTRRVRAFCEMAAILWARGNHAATIHLELAWARLCAGERLALFCAYPRDTFSRNANESIVEICRLHSRVAPPLA